MPTRRRWRLAFAAAVVAAVLMTVGPVVGYILGDLLVRDPPPPMLASQAGGEAPGGSSAARDAGSTPRVQSLARSPESPEPYGNVRRRKFARRMSEEGFVRVEGGWVHPETLERLAAEREKAGQGEVREGGA